MKEINLDELQESLVSQRTVLLYGEINRETAERCCFQLMSLAAKSTDSIDLVINSGGGKVKFGFDIVDTIRVLQSKKVSIHGIVIGRCSSTAVNVLQACSERLCTEHALFLIHQVSGDYSLDNVDNDGDDIDEVIKVHLRIAKWLSRKTTEIISNRSGRSIQEVEQARARGAKFNEHLTSDEALKFGLIDKIL